MLNIWSARPIHYYYQKKINKKNRQQKISNVNFRKFKEIQMFAIFVRWLRIDSWRPSKPLAVDRLKCNTTNMGKDLGEKNELLKWKGPCQAKTVNLTIKHDIT